MDAPEPYTVIEVVRGVKQIYDWDGTNLVKLNTERYMFTIQYRNYSRIQYFNIHAKDELEAFILGTQRLVKTKKHYDKHGKNKKEQNDERYQAAQGH